MIDGLIRSMIEYNNYTSEKTICDGKINDLEEKNEEYEEILSSSEVDGLLIGGASLDPDTFSKIYNLS